MIRKGILKGDKSFRKFTFDDEKCVNGKYECTYPKDALENNEFSDQEVLWLSESDMLVIGGPIKKKGPEQKPVQKNEQEKRKPGRPKKVVNVIPPPPALTPSSDGLDKYEYLVEESQMSNVNSLQERLNELGDAGWEMCGFETMKQMFSVNMVMIFKRKRD